MASTGIKQWSLGCDNGHLSAVCGVSMAEGTSGGDSFSSGMPSLAELGLTTSPPFRKLSSLFMACPATNAILTDNVAALLLSLLSTSSALPAQNGHT